MIVDGITGDVQYVLTCNTAGYIRTYAHTYIRMYVHTHILLLGTCVHTYVHTLSWYMCMYYHQVRTYIMYVNTFVLPCLHPYYTHTITGCKLCTCGRQIPPSAGIWDMYSPQKAN